MKRLLATMFLSLVMSFSFMPAFAHAQIPDEAPEVVPVKLQVPIPGLDFNGSVIVSGNEDVGSCKANRTCVTVIGDYLNGIFRYGLGAGIIFTIVLMMVGGVQWMVGSAIGSIDKAKKRIQNAAIGLLLLLTATVFLSFLNPAITALNTLEIVNVKPSDFDTGSQRSLFAQGVYSDALTEEGEPLKLVSINHADITSPGQAVHEDILNELEAVASALNSETGDGLPSKLLVRTGHRDPRRQVSQFYHNCMQGGPCLKPTCNPFSSSGETPIEGDETSGWQLRPHLANDYKTDGEIIEFLSNEIVESQTFACGHLTGYTVAAFCQSGYDNAFSVDANCQLRLEQLMNQFGFCRDYSYPWHFEFKEKLVEVPDCNATPGVFILPENQCGSTDEDECTVNYADKCIGVGKDPVDLRTGKCR